MFTVTPLRKVVFDECHMYDLEGDLSYVLRSILWGKEAKISNFNLYKKKKDS